MLRLVHPPTGGNGGDPPKRRRTLDLHTLTPTERQHLRAVLKNLRRAYGSWACLAEVMGVSQVTLERSASKKSCASPGLALRAARAAGMHVETMLSGELSSAGRCPTCGSRVGDGRVVVAGGAR